MRTLKVVTLGSVVALLAACGSGTVTAHGVMQVQEDCASAANDYPDIDQGAQVVVTNPNGAVVATGQLGNSQQKNLPGFGDYGAACNYPFTVQVPGGLARYGVTISHRGTIWFSAQQMQKGPGLTLGGS